MIPETSKNDILAWFDNLPRPEQQKFLTELGQRMKPIWFTLKVKAEIEEVALVLKYCTKNKIEHKTRRVKNKVHFLFPNKAERNKVLLGIRTL